jgi:hypothetical protein
MTAGTTSLAAIDMRVQPSWRWAEDDPPPPRAATLKGYDRVYGEEFRSLHTHASLVADLRRLNIRAVVQSEPIAGPAAAANDRVAAVIERAPDCFLAGFGSADPRDGLAALREIDRFHRDLGLRGLAMMADFFNMDISDKRPSSASRSASMSASISRPTAPSATAIRASSTSSPATTPSSSSSATMAAGRGRRRRWPSPGSTPTSISSSAQSRLGISHRARAAGSRCGSS